MSAGKGDWIPGANDAAYSENYPTIDWNARERAADAERMRKAGGESFAWAVEIGAIEIIKDKP